MYPSSFNEIQGIFVHQQAKELIKQGCEVRVICPIPWTPSCARYLSARWKKYSSVPDQSLNEGVTVYYPRYRAIPRNWFYESSGRRMYEGIHSLVKELYKTFKFEIIHAHTAMPDGYAALLLKEEYGKPLVVTIHGEDLQITIYCGPNIRKAIAKVLNGADKIVPVSTKLKNIAVQQIGLTQDKIAVINDGFNIEASCDEDQVIELRKKYINNRIILSVSNLVNTKGLDLNLRAMARLVNKYPNLRYLIIGHGPSLNSLRHLTHKLDLEKEVVFLGQLPHDAVMNYMSISDIFCLPSWEEGFGTVYLEAAAHGLPVIACKGEGIEDALTDEKTALFIERGNLENLVGSIESLIENPEKALGIGRSAQSMVQNNFKWETIALKIITVYGELSRINN
jgi:glycosyltransferase involved in cell wall biosynthesis